MCSGISRTFFTSFSTGPLNMLNIWKPISNDWAISHIFSTTQPRLTAPSLSHSDAGARFRVSYTMTRIVGAPFISCPRFNNGRSLYGGLELSPVPPCGRELCSKYPDFFPGQLFLCHRELLEIFPDKLRRGSGVENAESFQYDFVINDNNLEILHVVGCRSPTAGFENLFQISRYYLSIGIE